MEFTEYRSEALRDMWKRFWKQYGTDERNLMRKPQFHPHEIDNMCAINWKNENSVKICADVLFNYVKEIMESED